MSEKKYLLKNGLIINRGESKSGDILIKGERIEKIGTNINDPDAEVIDVNGQWIIPGIIDDQVHFREPGLTHKANIATESRAAAAGGVTSFMEMPNTNQPVPLRKNYRRNTTSQQKQRLSITPSIWVLQTTT